MNFLMTVLILCSPFFFSFFLSLVRLQLSLQSVIKNFLTISLFFLSFSIWSDVYSSEPSVSHSEISSSPSSSLLLFSNYHYLFCLSFVPFFPYLVRCISSTEPLVSSQDRFEQFKHLLFCLF